MGRPDPMQDTPATSADPHDQPPAPIAWLRGHSAAVRSVVIAVVLGLLILGGFRFAPVLADARTSLAQPSWGWVTVACWAQLVAMVQLARLQRSMLRTGGVRVSMRRALPLAFASNAMSVTLPGGTLVSSVYSFRRMRGWGASGPLIAFGLAVTTGLSGVTFAVIAVFGATFAGENPSWWTLGLEVAVALAAGLAVRHLVQRPALVARLSDAALTRVNRVRHRPAATGREQVREMLAELHRISPRGRDWARSVAFATVNWLADVLCLFACLRAVGLERATFAVALIAYVAGIAAANIPLSPGGLGIVDAALIFALVESGLPGGPAAAATVLYRLFSLVLVVVIGWVFWAVRRWTDRHRDEGSRTA